MNIAGRTFFITGGGSGLGAACAQRLAALGGRVIVADVRMDAARAIASAIGSAALSVHVDVTNTDELATALHQGRSHFGPLSGVVHCAGILAAGKIISRQGPHDLDHFRRVIEVNLSGTFNVLRLTADEIKDNEPTAEGERGVIITTTSVAAFEGQIGQAAYAAAKGGVAALTLPAARELGRYGIRVVSIAPGVFETDMMAATSEELRASLAAQVPFPPRFGRPDEFAQLVQQVIENPMLNGSVLRLDGALRMGQ